MWSGKSEADAAKALEDAGFEAVPNATYSDTVAVGLVVSQDPAGGATAQRGSAVSHGRIPRAEAAGDGDHAERGRQG